MDTSENIKNTKEFAKQMAKVVKVSREQKEKIYNKLFINFIIAIIIFIYFFALNTIYYKTSGEKFEEIIHIISCVLVVLLITEIEVAYRKDSDTLAIHGVELFSITMMTLFMPYVFLHRGEVLKFLYSISSMFIAIYYSIKCLIIYAYEMKKYKESLSDVKEIINDDKRDSYLDTASKRKFGNIEEPLVEEEKEIIEEKNSRTEKLEKMKARIRENQEKRRLAKQAKKERKEKEAVNQKFKEKYNPLKEEKDKEVVSEDKVKEEKLNKLSSEEIIEAEELTEKSVKKSKKKKSKKK